jgi:lysozyme
MKTSDNGIAFIIREEGKRNKAYKDSRGIWTIGVGHTSEPGELQVTPGLVISDEQIMDVLKRDLEEDAEFYVNKYVKVPLNQNQYDALVSLIVNIGGGNFKSSTVLRKLNAGDYEGAADAFLMWKRAGSDLDILLPRRKRERILFLKKVENNVGIHPAPSGPSEPVPERSQEAGGNQQTSRPGGSDHPGTTGSEQGGSSQQQHLRVWLETLRRLGVWLRAHL